VPADWQGCRLYNIFLDEKHPLLRGFFDQRKNFLGELAALQEEAREDVDELEQPRQHVEEAPQGQEAAIPRDE